MHIPNRNKKNADPVKVLGHMVEYYGAEFAMGAYLKGFTPVAACLLYAETGAPFSQCLALLQFGAKAYNVSPIEGDVQAYHIADYQICIRNAIRRVG